MSAKKHTKIVKGHLRFEQGLIFETEVADYLSTRGYAIESRHRTKTGEIDIIATKSDFLSKSILMVECKKKEIVTLGDFVKFVGKFMRFDARRKGGTRGVFAYKGRLDPKAKTYYETLDRDWHKGITLLKF